MSTVTVQPNGWWHSSYEQFSYLKIRKQYSRKKLKIKHSQNLFTSRSSKRIFLPTYINFYQQLYSYSADMRSCTHTHMETLNINEMLCFTAHRVIIMIIMERYISDIRTMHWEAYYVHQQSGCMLLLDTLCQASYRRFAAGENSANIHTQIGRQIDRYTGTELLRTTAFQQHQPKITIYKHKLTDLHWLDLLDFHQHIPLSGHLHTTMPT